MHLARVKVVSLRYCLYFKKIGGLNQGPNSPQAPFMLHVYLLLHFMNLILQDRSQYFTGSMLVMAVMFRELF